MCCKKRSSRNKISFLLRRWFARRRPNQKFYMSQMDGKWTLKRDCAHMNTIRHKHKSISCGDFVVWTESSIEVERITVDSAFFRNSNERGPSLLHLCHAAMQRLLASGIRGNHAVADCKGIKPHSSKKPTDDSK